MIPNNLSFDAMNMRQLYGDARDFIHPEIVSSLSLSWSGCVRDASNNVQDVAQSLVL